MPRLIGKRSNGNPVLALLFLLAIATGLSLEYLGYIDLIPGLGRDMRYSSQQGYFWKK